MAIVIDWERRARELQLTNDGLVFRVQQLEEELGVSNSCHLPFDLTRSEAMVFGVLMKNRAVRKSGFMLALYGDRLADPPDIKVVDIMVCKTRKKLAPHGIEIRTVWGVGYEIPEESKVRARQLMGGRT